MRMTYVLCFLLAAFSMPAAAADADQNLKQEMEAKRSAFLESFNRRDCAGIAALYASGGVMVNAAGPHTNIAEECEGTFKAGFDHEDVALTEVSPLGADTAIVMGEWRLTGKNQSGAPIEIAGLWTEVDVREGGKWKIRMLTAVRKPPQPPK